MINGCLTTLRNKFYEFNTVGQAVMTNLIAGIRSKDQTARILSSNCPWMPYSDSKQGIRISIMPVNILWKDFADHRKHLFGGSKSAGYGSGSGEQPRENWTNTHLPRWVIESVISSALPLSMQFRTMPINLTKAGTNMAAAAKNGFEQRNFQNQRICRRRNGGSTYNSSCFGSSRKYVPAPAGFNPLS